MNKNIVISYHDEYILDGVINAPEIFKLEFEEQELLSIKHLIFEELRK